MASEGLRGKKFVGKIVEGYDPLQRGRYYVHVSEFQPHMPESEGILLPNATHNNRASNGSTGSYGASSPLHVGTQVQVVCLEDDISSARIEEVVSDDQPKSDMGAGKMMGVEPSGQVVTAAVSGMPESTPFGSGGDDMMKQFSDILNSGGPMAQQFLSSVKDKLGPDIFSKMSDSFGKQDTTEMESKLTESMQNVQSAVEANGGGTNQFSNATVDDSEIGPENAITEEEKTQGFEGSEDEIIDKFLGPKEGINSGD